MLKKGTVLQSLVDRKPLRKGNTYHVKRVNLTIDNKYLFEDTFTIGYFDGTIGTEKNYLISELNTLFTVIDDDICPTCLKANRAVALRECLSCSQEIVK